MRQTAHPQKQWGMRAAGNFIAGGSGSGLIVVSALEAATGSLKEAALPMAVGTAGVALGLSLVWLEIGKPWRALNVFFHPETSWMTRESIVAGPLLLVGVAGAWFMWPATMLIAGLLAFGFLYCQARILRAARGIPAWRQAEIVPLIIATGLVEGAGLYLAVGSQSVPMSCFALAISLLREAVWHAYLRGLAYTSATAPSLAVLSSPGMKALRLLQVGSLAGLALSLLIGTNMGLRLAGVLIAVCGWGVKALIITSAALTRGAAIPSMPVRGRGAAR